ncbi:MAG: hypothetical protein KIT86_02475 [Hydrogenophaga sp.]|jgi:hypothetical protein|uniref:hypothetical protein n=1 Tax=Hydrogenophaga sp. TaxID=1904254 RepID=UPI002629020D|nr:hypothetical protein [Hydrogenophaga sp.]MCW5668496.1 hypothetical protein [Hydrogenophaga sp.]
MNTPALFAAALLPWLAACAPTTPAPPASERSPIVCTQDVLQCPDGRFVGRTPPGCVFVCPANTAPAAR